MKQLFTLLVASTAALAAGAQSYEGHKLSDNWSAGISAGAATPARGSYFGDTRGVIGAELAKDITPVIGVGLSTTAGFNTTGSHTAVDNLNTMLLGKVNLSNLFFGYPGRTRYLISKDKVGQPRAFEVVGVAGIGFNHFFGSAPRYAVATGNALSSKFGLDLNYNIGKQRAWTVSLRPAITYSLEGGREQTEVQYNLNNAAIELTAGVVYHFKSSNSRRHFTYVRPYDQAEVDGLNAKVNDLRADLDKTKKALRNSESELRRTQQKLNDARAERPVPTATKSCCKAGKGCCKKKQAAKADGKKQVLESVITFGQGSATPDAAQQANVKRLATYLREHSATTVVIKGYASPEGNAEANARLSERRAAAVRDLLVKRHGIAASRIKTEGLGVGDLYPEKNWNRVSICAVYGN